MIKLAWFRGAADGVTLDLDSKSAVVYGENGSGKSTFVDALEYAINDGRIGHLSHEYSGRHQEKGIINTHAPGGQTAELVIALDDASKLSAEIGRAGAPSYTGTAGAHIRGWNYGRTVLRQDEVASFIRNTKGGKYSAILPLLGLAPMEAAAENVRQLSRMVELRSGLQEGKGQLRAAMDKRKAELGELSDQAIDEKVRRLYKEHCPDKTSTEPLTQCKEARDAIAVRLEGHSDEQQRNALLLDISRIDLISRIGAMRRTSGALAAATEPRLLEKLDVLHSAQAYTHALKDDQDISCPACGTPMPSRQFRAHVDAEAQRLEEMMTALRARRSTVESLRDALKALKRALDADMVRAWAVSKKLDSSAAYLAVLDISTLRYTEDELQEIESKLLPVVAEATKASKKALPGVKDLSSEAHFLSAASDVVAVRSLAARLARAAEVVEFLKALENGIREEIRIRSQAVIDELSTRIQAMWAILHPGEAIEGVRLYIPEGADKAIDIEVKFFGVEQPSPRLTLSEGYRNSLGLCIFLAMAKRDSGVERPLFLDDVVVSLDRNHRGMIVEVLEKEFADRQVVVFTHDRAWYSELSQQLDPASWRFKALLPFEKPEVGIRWSSTSSTFGDARALLQGTPHAAGNTARKIMDTELAVRTERLHIRLPYLAATRNDHRTAHDFLYQIIADAPDCFQKKTPNGYEANISGVEVLRHADTLLVSWGNRASHTMDVVRPEAEKLINACEAALDVLKCTDCKKPVYKFEDSRAEILQCECGNLRWRYGNA